jgi:hypothetical protein
VLALGVEVVARAMELRTINHDHERLVEALCLVGGASDVRRAPLYFILFISVGSSV